jgi:hypothetical protein
MWPPFVVIRWGQLRIFVWLRPEGRNKSFTPLRCLLEPTLVYERELDAWFDSLAHVAGETADLQAGKPS